MAHRGTCEHRAFGVMVRAICKTSCGVAPATHSAHAADPMGEYQTIFRSGAVDGPIVAQDGACMLSGPEEIINGVSAVYDAFFHHVSLEFDSVCREEKPCPAFQKCEVSPVRHKD